MNFDSTPHASPCKSEADHAGTCLLGAKTPLSIPEQIQHLKDKGLQVDSNKKLQSALTSWGYYRLRGYWLTLEAQNKFLPGTRIDDILEIMRLDMELSKFISALISPLELQLRSAIVNCLANRHGPRALHEQNVFKDEADFEKLQQILSRELKQAKKSRKPLVLHNLKKYNKLPIWAEIEITSLGTLSKTFENLAAKADAKQIASRFGVPPFRLLGWLRYITLIRNMVAHNDRLYNRLLPVKPKLYSEHKHIDNARLFPVFIVLLRLHDAVDPARAQSARKELAGIVDAHPSVDLKPMGFPQDWRAVLAVPSSEPRSRGRNGGRKLADPDALAEALRMYNTRDFAISEIVETTHVSTSTLYKYIHLQEEG